MLQGLLYLLAALLALGAAAAALAYAQGPMSIVWAIQIAGLAVILTVLAIFAFAPDRPVQLKSGKR
ncbi:MAG: hypothetical protein RMM58_06595 [Chloroflexota bacterium]|nr:hypothetical protein [Dehalococcoidia bacterium]MDW8253530.1 hypothetical protein [Chloroflexota bacterium]